ncbi:PREDICTED: fatty acid synthase-like [Wasmannia auropunctata]|uniref:fatty acid synthase-like n=1 Tax=Wasmannia auropunctata TaxID=64793 RepID=UPI0005EF34EC|nr:PREDICTED: fatty acid synthase-like [Wasmannia auropunctata]
MVARDAIPRTLITRGAIPRTVIMRGAIPRTVITRNAISRLPIARGAISRPSIARGAIPRPLIVTGAIPTKTSIRHPLDVLHRYSKPPLDIHVTSYRYAICPHIKLNCDGYKEEGVTYPSSFMQETLLTEFYKECGISTSCLDYVEAHGTATKAGDPPEIQAIANVLCKNRETPLMIGSVKSNLGHAESAAGFDQIAKVKQ